MSKKSKQLVLDFKAELSSHNVDAALEEITQIAKAKSFKIEWLVIRERSKEKQELFQVRKNRK